MKEKKDLKGLRGWLLLPVLSLIFTPFFAIYAMTELWPVISDKEVWSTLTEPTSLGYHKLWAPLIIGELSFNLIDISFCLLLLWHAFKHSNRFPKLMIIFLLLDVIMALFDTGIFLQIRSDMSPELAQKMLLDKVDIKSLGGTFTSALIWIPYFIRSRRVANTFIQPYGLIPLKKKDKNA